MVTTVPSLLNQPSIPFDSCQKKIWTKRSLLKQVCGYHVFPGSTAKIGTETQGLGQSAIFSLVRSSLSSQKCLFKWPFLFSSSQKGLVFFQWKTSRETISIWEKNVQPAIFAGPFFEVDSHTFWTTIWDPELPHGGPRTSRKINTGPGTSPKNPFWTRNFPMVGFITVCNGSKIRCYEMKH